jgi:hypothetical protein
VLDFFLIEHQWLKLSTYLEYSEIPVLFDNLVLINPWIMLMRQVKLDELFHLMFVDMNDILIVELIDKKISQIQMTLMYNEVNFER